MVLTVAVIIAIYLTHISIEDIKTHTISNFTPIITLLASPFLSWISFKDRIIGLLVVSSCLPQTLSPISEWEMLSCALLSLS